MRSLGASFTILLACSVGCATEPGASSDDDTAAADDPTTAAPVMSEYGVALASVPHVLRGVDRASVFSTHEAHVLDANHGVKWSGVYIGGACNGGSGWTRSRVKAIANATGWRFMPIWVGQQSPSICGAHRLTYSRGVSDAHATVSAMKAFGWLPHRAIPVALDVESGTYYYSPGGSTSYVRGWVNTIHAAGYRAYVYGSPFGLNTFHDKHVRIDAAWAASYFYTGFRSIAPGLLSQMGNRFRNHNRAWQYAGNFSVSGAGRVDANTSDLLLAPAPGGTNAGHAAKRTVPAACGTLSTGEGLVRGEALASCDGRTQLALGSDGALTVSKDGVQVWSAGTDGAGVQAVLDDNGELIVVDADGEQVFSTDTFGNPDAHVELADGGLQVTGDDGTALWSDRSGLLATDDPVDDLGDDADFAP